MPTEGSSSSSSSAAAIPEPSGPSEEIVNALAGDEVDDDLADLVAELEAPIRVPGRKSAKVAAPPAPAARRRRRAGKGGVAPAWLVDISGIDFGAASLQKLQVKELKSFLYGREEKLTGGKKELVERVTASLATEPYVPSAESE